MTRVCPTCNTPWTDEMEYCPHDGTALPPPNDTWDSLLEKAVAPQDRLQAGAVLGQYRIVRLLGEGGMATVYEAEHKLLGRRVAVKVLQQDMISFPEVVERFFQEARVVNQIKHPNIVDITDFGEATDKTPPYMVMEFVEGKDLAHLVAERAPMAPEFIVHVGKQVCDAMQAVHEAGIVHRDLKPDNIMMLTPDYRDIRLLDFGIVKFLATDKAFLRTATGQTLGTPEYMAPEQVRGKDLDARTDIYALGVIFYEMATGKTPFDGHSLAEVFQNQLSKIPPPPSQVLERPFDPALEEVILKCLEKDPGARYQSMAELGRALDAAEGPTRLSDPFVPVPPSRASRRGLWIAAALVLLALVGVAAWLMGRKKNDSRPVGSAQSETATGDATVANAPDGSQSRPRGVSGRNAGAASMEDASVRRRDAAITGTVLVETKPKGASIYDLATGQFLGKSPLSLARSHGRYQVRLDGYEPMDFAMSPDIGDRVELLLKKKVRQTKSARTKKKRHRPRSAHKSQGSRHRRSPHKVDEYGTVDPFKSK